jgi:hypothetical protein
MTRTISITMHATRCTTSIPLLNQNPGSLAFSCNMLLDIPFITDFVALKASRQLQIDKHLLHANASHCPHDFSVGENIYVRNGQMKSKLQPPWEGLFPIIGVHTNGTVTPSS